MCALIGLISCVFHILPRPRASRPRGSCALHVRVFHVSATCVFPLRGARARLQRSSCLPDENNVAQLQEEVKQLKLRELATLTSFRETQDAVTDLNQRWQVPRTHARTHTGSTNTSGTLRTCFIPLGSSPHPPSLLTLSTTCRGAAEAAAAIGRSPPRRTP